MQRYPEQTEAAADDWLRKRAVRGRGHGGGKGTNESCGGRRREHGLRW